MANQHHPYHPIVYVRGFAATSSEIEDAVSDPYMGFNVGSTKTRTVWTGEVKRFYFESPLVRLMGDHDYDDVFVEGEDMAALEQTRRPVPYRSVVIYRYYDDASRDFGTGTTPPIEHFARGLSALILRLRERICANPKNAVTPDEFRVYLVAHSMGGLVCRAFLQNPSLGDDLARRAVDKLYTYATPHNGIDMRVVRNVPGWISFGDVNNFNRDRMATYLALPKADDVSVVTGFPADRIFNLIGTNPHDYGAAWGASSWAVGDQSDGLVRIENATTHGLDSAGRVTTSPRAFVHRSHSGHYGIVNSEEGYQNLTRFFFGKLRIDGVLEVDDITLPVEVQKEHDAGKSIKASYQFEVAVSLRGCQWQMTRRDVRENSAIFRRFDQLFRRDGDKVVPDRSQSPHLFSAFLDPSKSVRRPGAETGADAPNDAGEEATGPVSLSFDLNVLVPDYEVDGVLFMKRHYEGGYIYRNFIIVEAFPDEKALGGWRIKYGFQDRNPGKPGVDAETSPARGQDALEFSIPIEQKSRPGITGRLRIEARNWS